MNKIKTWRQGSFVDSLRYKNMGELSKRKQRELEQHLVRPEYFGNDICFCKEPEHAKWIASRLNLAAKLEELANLIASGADTKALETFIEENIK